jgi:peptidoglycan/LPS O-acetylase OafA/YrhL
MKNVEIKKYDYIDSIRGLAILGVILVHSSQWVAPTSSVLSVIAREGARGVQLFYIVSALTLFLSMAARKKQEERANLSFFIRRLFRIAPAFYCAIILYTVYSGMSVRPWAPNGLKWWYIALTAFFMHGWHPETITSVVPGGWSIAVEMTFYLFVPYLFLRLSSIKSTLIALILSMIFSRIISIATFFILVPYYPESQQYLVSSFVFLWFFSQLPIFISGILLYHIINKYPHCDKRTAFFILLASLLLLTSLSTVQTFGYLLPKHFLYGLAFIPFTLSLHYSPQILFINRFTMLFGKLSFSMYLVHFMVIDTMKILFNDGFFLDGNTGFIMAFILVLILSVCISYITYKTIETPGINIGKLIVKKL